MKGKTIAICNQKGGVGKTTTAIALGAALTLKGKRILLVDCDDSNPTLTKTLITGNPTELPCTLVDLMLFTILERDIKDELPKAIYHHDEGFDILPATNKLPGITTNLNAQQDTNIKNQALAIILSLMKEQYDYIIIDAAPALNTLSINVLAAADEVIIATQAQDAAEAGICEFMQTVSNVKKMINPTLLIRGLLITMEDNRTNYSKKTAKRIATEYTDLGMKVFDAHIPRAVKGEEYMKSGSSIISYDPKGKVSTAYIAFSSEYLEV